MAEFGLKSTLSRLLSKWLAVELAAGLVAMAEFLVAGPVVAYLRFHVPLFPFWGVLVLMPRSFGTPRRVWTGGISPVTATLILIAVTALLAAILYVLLLYYTGR